MRMVFCAADTPEVATRSARSNTTRNAFMERSFPTRSLHHEPRGRPVSRGPVAEPAGDVGAPAIGGACGRDPAGVEDTSAHRGEAHATRHEYWAQLGGRGP